MNYEKAIKELASYIFINYEERFLSGDEPDEVIFDVYLEDITLIQDLEDFGIDSRTVDLESVRYDIEKKLWEMYDSKRKENL